MHDTAGVAVAVLTGFSSNNSSSSFRSTMLGMATDWQMPTSVSCACSTTSQHTTP
jgi:hypothetical protein